MTSPTGSDSTIDANAASVQTHLGMLQGVIGRLANNSASCKAWCVSLTSALVVVVASYDKLQLLGAASLPIVLFCALDAYYLGLERRFRNCYEQFVRKLHDGTAQIDDAFVISPPLRIRGLFVESFEALLSFSIWPFYLGLALITWVLGVRLAP